MATTSSVAGLRWLVAPCESHLKHMRLNSRITFSRTLLLCVQVSARVPWNSDQRDGNLNTHSVVPPAGLSISGVKLECAELRKPLPATTATYCSP